MAGPLPPAHFRGWDRISADLGGSPNGETLRRNFGADEEAR
jgi:hypothetical protein